MSTVNEVRDMLIMKKRELEEKKAKASLANEERLKSLVNPLSREETERVIEGLLKANDRGHSYYAGENKEKVKQFAEWFNYTQRTNRMEIVDTGLGFYSLKNF